MKTYRLIALSVSANGNRVLHKSDNETYTEDVWDEGVAERLVKDGFLEVVTKKAAELEAEKAADEEAAAEKEAAQKEAAEKALAKKEADQKAAADKATAEKKEADKATAQREVGSVISL